MTSYGTLRSIQSLGIVYSCVARGKVILAYYASFQGNFPDVVPGVLAVIPPNRDDKMTYTSGDYMFHYVTERGVTILCITEDDFERSKAFLFLEEAKSKFLEGYGDNLSRYTPYCLNSTFGEFLRQTMGVYSDDTFINIESEGSQRIRLDTINVRELGDSYGESGRLEQLELLQSDDDISVRSYEAQLDDHKNRVKSFIRRHFKAIMMTLALAVIFLIVMTAIIVISLVEKIEKKESSG